MRVFWTDVSLNQLEAIRDFLAQTSTEYAQRIVERLVNRSEQIAAFPRSGRMVPEYEIDEVRQVIEGSYRIIYLTKKSRLKYWQLSIHLAKDYRRKNKVELRAYLPTHSTRTPRQHRFHHCLVPSP